MLYIILGIVLTVGIIFALQWFISADPKDLIRIIKWLLIIFIISIILFFIITGKLIWAIATMPMLLPWLLRVRQAVRRAKNFSRMQGRTQNSNHTGQTSDLETRHLYIRLNHENGSIDGEVREGLFAGRQLSSMKLDELITLLRICEAEDTPSAKILKTYMDRVHENWQEKTAPFESVMKRKEAASILGVAQNATPDEVRKAYHKLMAGVHPDHGGSSYLASKINQAKDVLLNVKS